jgi:putative transcriptional regulator
MDQTMPSLRGHFLLSSVTLRDPNFARSVIFMIKHDEVGAVGLIVNNPLDISVGEALEAQFPTAPKVDLLLYQGGPCQGPMMLLHGGEVDDSIEVIPGVHFTEKRAAIEEVMADADIPQRYFHGYAGWEADQLEREMAEGSWVIVPATPAEVFTDATADLWDKLTARANLMKFVSPEKIPEDPGLN